MIILNTERLIIRTFGTSDLLPLSTINSDPRVMEYFPRLQTKAETAYFIQKSQEHFRQHRFSWYAIELRQQASFIGFIGIYSVTFQAAFTPTVEIGWRLAYPYWGKGLATEGAQAILKYAFEELQLPEIVSFTPLKNRRSQRVMEKIGLEHYPENDFDHPKLPKEHPLCRHVLYRIKNNIG